MVVVGRRAVLDVLHGGLARVDPAQEPVVVEAAHAGGEADEDGGGVAGGGGEGVLDARRDRDEVAGAQGVDLVVDEDVELAGGDVEELGGLGVEVHRGARRALLEGGGVAGELGGVGEQGDEAAGGVVDGFGGGGAGRDLCHVH